MCHPQILAFYPYHNFGYKFVTHSVKLAGQPAGGETIENLMGKIAKRDLAPLEPQMPIF